jgi:DNA-binding NarL/FixJ family response regulator
LYSVFIADSDRDNLRRLSVLFRELYGVRPQVLRGLPSGLDGFNGPEEIIVLVRVDRPDIGVLRLTKEVRKRSPNSQLVWMSRSDAHCLEAFSYGADAYLLLPASEDKLREVLHVLALKRKIHPRG